MAITGAKTLALPLFGNGKVHLKALIHAKIV